MSKRKKIRFYLNHIDKSIFSDFEYLLDDYVNKNLKTNLKKLGLTNVSVHIDWLKEFKIISVQCKYGKYYVEFQVDKNEIAFAYDEDEADNDTFYAVKIRTSNQEFYCFLKDRLNESFKRRNL